MNRSMYQDRIQDARASTYTEKSKKSETESPAVPSARVRGGASTLSPSTISTSGRCTTCSSPGTMS